MIYCLQFLSKPMYPPTFHLFPDTSFFRPVLIKISSFSIFVSMITISVTSIISISSVIAAIITVAIAIRPVHTTGQRHRAQYNTSQHQLFHGTPFPACGDNALPTVLTVPEPYRFHAAPLVIPGKQRKPRGKGSRPFNRDALATWIPFPRIARNAVNARRE